MMHPYLDKKHITKKKKIIRNIIGFGLFLILVTFGVLSWASQIFNYVGSPIWKAEKFITDGFYNINYLFRTKAVITNENHNLIEEISNIRLTLTDYQILKSENIELRELLGRVGENHDFILGNILTKPNHSPYDTITIDIGKNEGLKEGNRVYANGNVPVGVVSNVYEKTSLITLYTNPGQKTEGFLDISNASVSLTGRGGGNFEMIVPIELFVENGTIVYLPSDKALVIAQVDETISKPSDPFKKVILSSPVNAQNLKWVQVKKD